MRLRDTDWYPALAEFERIANDHYRDVFSEQFEELQEDDDAIEYARNIYRNRRDASQRAHAVRTTLMAAFLRYGELGRRTNWSFRTFFPLRTHEGDSADVLVGNQSDGAILLGIILPDRSRPESVIDKGLEVIESVRNNIDPLQDDIGLDFHPDRIKVAIVVDDGRGQETGNEIVDRKGSQPQLEEFYVWRVRGTNGEKFDLYTNFRSGSEHRNEDPLGRILEDGVQVIDSPHSIPDFFYDVHHSRLLEHTVTVMASEQTNTDIPNTHFSEQGVREYYTETLHGPNSENKAFNLAERIIERWLEMDIITAVSSSSDKIGDGSETYRFRSRKKNAESIYYDLEEEYESKSIEFLLKVRAIKETISEYLEESGSQSDLAEYGFL
ncbi:hypothetical protein [Haloarchaeobius sp. DYHT-AS-18]|uniref:hypothetical protein n=1 Tax=Haloarchaeobius sp. DYHT-AS-18 TaxID=3446117 RepID=UPI003EBB9654